MSLLRSLLATIRGRLNRLSRAWRYPIKISPILHCGADGFINSKEGVKPLWALQPAKEKLLCLKIG